MLRFALPLAFLPMLAVAAHAADPQMRGGYFPEPAPVVLREAPRGFDWNRCYVGAQAGASIGNIWTQQSKTAFFNANYIRELTTGMIGPAAGLQAGCNMVLQSNFLVGLELEGIYQSKHDVPCAAQMDPTSYCLDIRKKAEAIASMRLGYTFGGACGDCGSGVLVYARFGVGYGRVDVKANVNMLSYLSKPAESYWGANLYTPNWAQNYDVQTSRTAFSPVLGFGVEKALDPHWTIRADISAMLSLQDTSDLQVTKINFVNGKPGDPLPNDPSGVARNAKVGDAIPFKIREIETRVSMGVNRLF
ncbi:MAG: hypothetical protein JWL93_860 [Hyphomicrobiales bacterium]|nr:hypothetical protein [Hyphomicrobiales bacterium]